MNIFIMVFICIHETYAKCRYERKMWKKRVFLLKVFSLFTNQMHSEQIGE